MLADLLVVFHLVWIIFMLWGFALTIRGFFRPAFFDRWLFRTVHLLGILFVAALEPLGRYCPLTVWEHELRDRGRPPLDDYPGAFIIDNIERLIYIDVDPWMIAVPTAAIALFTLTMFIMRSPAKFQWMRR